MAALGLELHEQAVPVWDGRLELDVQVAGKGPPLVYLHPAAGLAWDPFLERLAAQRTIHAPRVPGTTPGKPEAIREVDDLWDLVLVYEEAIRALGLDRPAVIGQSFGGMLACELAATFPALFSRVVLLDPIGLWLDEHPVANWVAAAPEELPALLFHDPDGEAARVAMTPPADPDAAIAAIAALSWAIGCTAKFVWPIPDKGLVKRLHRIEAPTLIIWGKEDRLVSSAYAAEFERRIAGSRVEIIDECGHIPQLEQPEKTYALVSEFLGLAAESASQGGLVTASPEKLAEAVPSADDLIGRAIALRPKLVEQQAEVEERTYYSQEMHEEFQRAGFYRMFMPRRYGGLEVSVPTFMRVVVEIARGCPSTVRLLWGPISAHLAETRARPRGRARRGTPPA